MIPWRILIISFQCFLVTFSTQRLIFVFFAEQNSSLIVHQTMAYVSQSATLHADGMHFGNLVCDGTQGRNRAKRNSLEVHIQSSNDDSDATVSQFVANFNEAIIKNWASSIPTTSMSEANKSKDPEDSIGVDRIEFWSWLTTSSSE